jgi:hypothetical protein
MPHWFALRSNAFLPHVNSESRGWSSYIRMKARLRCSEIVSKGPGFANAMSSARINAGRLPPGHFGPAPRTERTSRKPTRHLGHTRHRSANRYDLIISSPRPLSNHTPARWGELKTDEHRRDRFRHLMVNFRCTPRWGPEIRAQFDGSPV